MKRKLFTVRKYLSSTSSSKVIKEINHEIVEIEIDNEKNIKETIVQSYMSYDFKDVLKMFHTNIKSYPFEEKTTYFDLDVKSFYIHNLLDNSFDTPIDEIQKRFPEIYKQIYFDYHFLKIRKNGYYKWHAEYY
jgi:hypothetical protein